jgi:hypothetical protein
MKQELQPTVMSPVVVAAGSAWSARVGHRRERAAGPRLSQGAVIVDPSRLDGGGANGHTPAMTSEQDHHG